ncbi:SMC-Scp complex subunit ScpB [Krasilnikovia cinnamomea]|uniref:SMC-Scp complex subunit ScpB n=1 Tax=Krasilnikovia cinnamomea TaxID=349313 RepID=UPI003BF9182F
MTDDTGSGGTDEPGAAVAVADEAGEPLPDLADSSDLAESVDSTEAEWDADAGPAGAASWAERAPDVDGEQASPAAGGALDADAVQVGPTADAEGVPDADIAQAPPAARADDVQPGADEAEREPMADAELRAALEAILLVVDEPVAELQLAQILEEPAERVAAALEEISAGYTAAGHGFDLRRAAGGWRLYTRPEYARYVERFVLDGQSVRLTQAALETLAVVAYKQPVTRSRISAIRGVNCDGVMRTLVTRGLIEECGTERETGAFLYRTTALFLEKLGLNSVDELPPLAPFLPDDVEEVLDASG